MSLSPPRPKGPHLNALRAFESAGRLESFAAAADELSVTAGAISQHIKSLEAWAEGKLFDRNAKGVMLTPLGEELLPEFTAAFDQLSTAVQSLRSKSAPHKIAIATLPSIAQMWLSGKLGRIRTLIPEVSISVVAVETPPNLDREPYDVTLFFQEDDPKSDEHILFQDRIFPVCAPWIAERLNDPVDLEQEMLLYDSTWQDDWDIWFSQFPKKLRLRGQGSTHSLFSVAVEEACNGAGVLMAHEALVQHKLNSGELVAPFDQAVSLSRSLVMGVAKGFQDKPEFQAFREAMG